MAPLHTTTEGQELLRLLDRLEGLGGNLDTIPLTKLVAIGQRSSGKSSVLRAISGVRLPIGDEICTRFPIEVRLRRRKEVSMSAKIQYSTTSGISEIRQTAFQQFEDDWSETSLDKLDQVFQAATEVLATEFPTYLCSESLLIEACGPDQQQLTVVDLPGFFVATQIDQPSTDISLVGDIIRKYTNGDDALVLAVASADMNPDNQQIFEELKTNRSLRDYTLGIITCPDLLKPNALRHQFLEELLQKNRQQLAHGWHVLLNPKNSGTKPEYDANHDTEQVFFQTHMPWRNLDPEYMGIEPLKDKISNILVSKTSRSLSQCQYDIEERLQSIVQGLLNLGPLYEDSIDIQQHLSHVARRFQSKVDDAMWDPLNSNPQSLVHIVQRSYTEFADDLYCHGHQWMINLNKEGQLYFDTATKGEDIPVKDMIEIWQSKIYSTSEGEPQDHEFVDWAALMFRTQSQSWPVMTQHHCDKLFAIVENFVQATLSSCAEQPVVEALMYKLVTPVLHRMKVSLDARLQDLIKPYRSKDVHCFGKRHDELCQTLQPPPVSLSAEADNVWALLRSAGALYLIARDAYTENVIHLGFEQLLIGCLKSILDPELISSMTPEQVVRLGWPSEESLNQRHSLMVQKWALQEARDRVLPELRALDDLHPSTPGGHEFFSATSSPQVPCAIQVLPATPPMQSYAFDAHSPSSVQQVKHSRSYSSSSFISSVITDSPNSSIFSRPVHSRTVSNASSYWGSPEREDVRTDEKFANWMKSGQGD